MSPSQRNLLPSSRPATQDAGERRAPTCQPAPPRAASLQVLPALGGLQAAATSVHTRSTALALSSQVYMTRDTHCVHMCTRVYTRRRPLCTRALGAEDRPQRVSPRLRPAPHTFPFHSCSYNLEKYPKGIRVNCIHTLHAGSIIIQAKGLLDFTLKVPTVQMTKTPPLKF